MLRYIAVSGFVLLVASIGSFALYQVKSSVGQNRPTGHEMSPNIDLANAINIRLNALRPIHKGQQEAIANGDYKALETQCQKGLGIDKLDAFSWTYLAEADEKLKKRADELAAYRALIYPQGWGSSINSDPTTHMKYVLALLRNNIWDEAVAVYNKALPVNTAVFSEPLSERRFDVNRREFARLQGMAQLYLGSHSPKFRADRKGEILSHLQAAIKAQPGLAIAYYAYGRQLEEENRTVEAKAAYQKAINLGSGELRARAQKNRKRLP